MDYMHCLLLRLWFASSYHKELWYIGSNVGTVDERLCSIRPTKEIQRTPRKIATSIKYWKGSNLTIQLGYTYGMYLLAHELQMWLLHYSPVVLRGILPDIYYQHHLLLVEGAYLLLKDSISNQDLEKSFKSFKHYCYLFPSYYGIIIAMCAHTEVAIFTAGEHYMTVCLHSLMHLPDCVRNLGPLWCHSCFTFESANGDLLKVFHGSMRIEKQVNFLSIVKALLF